MKYIILSILILNSPMTWAIEETQNTEIKKLGQDRGGAPFSYSTKNKKLLDAKPAVRTPQCPQEKEINAFKAKEKLSTEHDANKFANKFARMCKLAAENYTCSVEKMAVSQAVDLIKRNPVSLCDYQQWLTDADGAAMVFTFKKK